MSGLLPWIIFGSVVLGLLALDLGVFHRKSHEVKIKEALIWSAVWISLALLFNVFVYFTRGSGPALEFLTGYLIEEALSVDNLFVFLLVFSYFRVPANVQHKVLFWGILGALVMRAMFIVAGIALDSEIPLDRLRLRRIPGIHGNQDGDGPGKRDSSREEFCIEAVSPDDASHGRL